MQDITAQYLCTTSEDTVKVLGAFLGLCWPKSAFEADIRVEDMRGGGGVEVDQNHHRLSIKSASFTHD